MGKRWKGHPTTTTTTTKMSYELISWPYVIQDNIILHYSGHDMEVRMDASANESFNEGYNIQGVRHKT